MDQRVIMAVATTALLGIGAAGVYAQEWGTLSGMHCYRETFGLTEAPEALPFRATPTASDAPGNVYHVGEQPRFQYQVENLTDEPLRAEGRIDIIRYAAGYHEGDPWWPELRKLEELGSVPVSIDLAPRGYVDLEVEPPTPPTLGGYGLVLDLGEAGRAYLTSYVRTFVPRLGRERFPKQSLEEMPPAILERLGVQAIRYGVSYVSSSDPTYEEYMGWLDEELRRMHEHRVTCVAEIGAGRHSQPLGRPRPHLDDEAVMLDTKSDMVWLPSDDDDYEEFVYELCANYGWPKGPITGFMLWNEPWEGLSISGWGADMLRYRDLYRRMGEAVHRANEEAGVQVLVGGCDSSTNTWDKLFPDGSDEFLPYLDFCSIHYQGLSAPVLYPLWNDRPQGRVLVWDTESWVANSDDRIATVVATNRAAGYDRSLGHLSTISISTLSHNRIAMDEIRAGEERRRVPKLIEARPPAAAIGAVQHFIGQREFREILFQSGLPWVYVFNGLEGNPDDGVVVVVGDISSVFSGGCLYDGVRCLAEVDAKKKDRQALRDSAPGSPERVRLLDRLNAREPWREAELRMRASEAYGLYDFYGNAVPAGGNRITIPLDARGFFLKPSGEPGSMDALLQALREARVEGIEAVDIVARDFLGRPEDGSLLRLSLTNMLGEALDLALDIELEGLAVEAPASVRLEPWEREELALPVTGPSHPSNGYLLSIELAGGNGRRAVHGEELRVNLISRMAIVVDGSLEEWSGALPQTIQAAGGAAVSFEERMYLPFVDFPEGVPEGTATGYLAYDEKALYFAAKIVDDTPWEGSPRFAQRDEDADFYPEVCYARREDGSLERLVWPEGVRRFSYRRWPVLPSSDNNVPMDNVLLAFNAIPVEEDEWLTNLPGRPFGFVWYKDTDYEFALNHVAPEYGGGGEVWRLLVPGMPRKHFYPRQPRHPLDGPAVNSHVVTRYEEGVRITEASIAWEEIPDVRERLARGETVKFSFRVNHNTGGPTMELAKNRSVSKVNHQAFHPDWAEHWANELEFAFETP